MSKRLLTTGAAAAVALVVVAVWFQPQALLFDRVVDEELPAAAAEPSGGGEVAAPTESEAASEAAVAPKTRPTSLLSGEFMSRSRYSVRGAAAVYELSDGRRVLRLERFATTNGPDLRVYLSAATSGDSDDDIAETLLDLGPLKGNRGNQNYEIPAGTELADYGSAVIWCRRFAVGFGVADLSEV